MVVIKAICQLLMKCVIPCCVSILAIIVMRHRKRRSWRMIWNMRFPTVEMHDFHEIDTEENWISIVKNWNQTHSVRFISNINTAPRFTFEQFLQFYALNTDAWRIENFSGTAPLEVPIRLEEHVSYRGFDCIAHPIWFTDDQEWDKYMDWVIHEFLELREAKRQKAENAHTEAFIKLVQSDIDEAYRNLHKAMENSMDAQEKVLKSAKEEHEKLKKQQVGLR